MPTSHRSQIAVLVILLVLAVNGFTLGAAGLLTPAETFSDTAALPAFSISQTVSWLLLTLLVPLVPSLFVPGRRGTPPAWLMPVVQVVFALQAATHFFQGMVAHWLSSKAPEVLDLPFTWEPLEIVTVGIWIAFLITNVTFALALWRAGHSVVGAVLMALGAVATPAIGPLGAATFALGLGIITLSALRSRSADAHVVPEPATV